MKIWGFRSGGMGDLINVEPLLRYMEKKYPGSYKYWCIWKKYSQVAPVFIGHPLIDKIIISEHWHEFGSEGLKIKSSCDVILNEAPQFPNRLWYNDMNAMECSWQMAGINDVDSVLTKQEQIPRLYKWFTDPTSSDMPENQRYSMIEYKAEKQKKIIGVFPFAKYGEFSKRSPSKEWWELVVSMIKSKYGDTIELRHFGWVTEPYIGIDDVKTKVSYFEQIQLATECDLILGTDAGTMWIIGAYSIPSIHLMTYHFPGHVQNQTAFMPVNENGVMIFDPRGCSLINPKLVLEQIERIL